MHKLKGDTLIEVALAIGIFSLVAITVVSVVSASLTGAQSALETTVTREELDGQAEALRFIHDSYVSGTQSKKVTDNVYGKLWTAITARAVPEDSSTAVLDFNPETCSSIYTGTGLLDTSKTGPNPFIINTRQLSSADPNKIIVASKPSDTKGIFYQAATYPRIIYGDIIGSGADGDDLYSQTTSEYLDIKRVEGIFITVVKGESKIVKDGGNTVQSEAAHYDFYIHSCWMPPNTDRASTISTVVRLYDPAVIVY
ncbi:hypothetical protein IKG07_02555 [Candidatus Saccharibacteria bacterium]|nr:hypothetical protein [Candidatus Saccharibacteria bacterium]